MKKIAILSLVFPFLLTLGACSAPENVVSGEQEVLRVFNWEDYIYLNDGEDYPEPDLTVQFEQYMKEQGRNVLVIYDTFDTNETMLNSLKTGRVSYDLVCPSDYMIQRMLASDMLVPFEEDWLANSNYKKYVSPYLNNMFNAITATNTVTGETHSIGEYAVGYMWGTLGIIFNPAYGNFEGLDALTDFQDWHALWDEQYHGTFSIKDSMRDTYAVGIMETYDVELEQLLEQYQSGSINSETYNSALNEIFNRCDDEEIEEVKQYLLTLKNNSFGFEVDSGKEDIKTGKIGANTAWSGDAVYAMDGAEEEQGVELYYSVPRTGSNIWFDGWCMPKGANVSLAQEFLDFISLPENASQNMDYIGYTPFICGNEILDLVRSWYDLRSDYGLFYKDENEELFNVGFDYDEFVSLSTTYPNDLYVYWLNEDSENDPSVEDIIADYDALLASDSVEEYEDEGTKYLVLSDGELENLDVESLDVVDLTYLFNGTLLDENEEIIASSDDAMFLVYDYLYEDENSAVENVAVGRQFFCQYPDLETLTRCAVMADYGSQNEAVLTMWEEVKSNALPIWAIILLVLEIALALGVFLYYYISKKVNLKERRNRRNLTK